MTNTPKKGAEDVTEMSKDEVLEYIYKVIEVSDKTKATLRAELGITSVLKLIAVRDKEIEDALLPSASKVLTADYNVIILVRKTVGNNGQVFQDFFDGSNRFISWGNLFFV